MNDLLKELDYLYQLLSCIPVCGDSVDAMAAARAKVRRIRAEMQNTIKED